MRPQPVLAMAVIARSAATKQSPSNFVSGNRVRLFCDEMLARLGRWLRAAGYDTAIAAGGMPDAALIARCVAEDRILLTRDRYLAAVADGRVSIVCLAETDLARQARALRAALDIDWEHAPFTR